MAAVRDSGSSWVSQSARESQGEVEMDYKWDPLHLVRRQLLKQRSSTWGQPPLEPHGPDMYIMIQNSSEIAVMK